MNKWIRSMPVTLALMAVCFLSINCNSIKKNNSTVHYVVQVSQDESFLIPMKELVNRCLIIIKNRLTETGFPFSIKPAGPNLIDVIVTADSSGILLTKQLVESSNELEFRELYSLSEITRSIECAAKTLQGDAPMDTTHTRRLSHPTATNNIFSLIAFSLDADGRIVDDGTMGRSMVRDTAVVTKTLGDPKIRNCFPQDIEFCYGPAERLNNVDNKTGTCAIYAVRTKMRKALLTNENVKYAQSDKGNDGKPELILGFDQVGGRIFEKMTTENRGGYIAIILDKRVISAPHVESAVSGGMVSIHGNFTKAEVDLLAHQLNAGYLQANLHVVLQEIVTEKP